MSKAKNDAAKRRNSGDSKDKKTQAAALSASVRGSLRFWGVACALYALLLASAVLFLMPWKSPSWNTALLLYAGLHAAAAPGLFTARRWGWRLATAAAFLGFVLLLLLVSGLVASFLYLRSVYGVLGMGVSIGALLFASVALQLLGLYPALMLRAMLRKELRTAMAGSRHWLKAVLGVSCLPVLVSVLVAASLQTTPREPLEPNLRTQTTSYLRAQLEGQIPPALDALAGVELGAGPLFVTLWDGGRVLARVRGEGEDLKEAVESAAVSLRAATASLQRTPGSGRLKVDRVLAVYPIPSEYSVVLALSVDPGRDGLLRGDWDAVLLPDDLVKAQLFGSQPLVPGIDEVRFGLAAKPALEALSGAEGALRRFRTESWIEYEDKVLVVERGNTTELATGPSAWREAAIAGGDFILRQLRKDGSFHYQYFPLQDHHPPPDPSKLSLPRHAGTVYALALLYRDTGEERFKLGAERAIAWLDTRMGPECGTPERACVLDGEWASLGAAALTMVGMLEYQRATQDPRYEPVLRRLAAFVLMMQKDDGNFYHQYAPGRDFIDPERLEMFYSEEAALALVMAHEVLGEQRYLDAAKAALDYLTGPKYEMFFLGQFIYGADHWTCIAVGEAFPRLDSRQYL
ncbi:MAG: hypothetical protein RBU37_28145, partial [Myxococcota bacterium]|nr:hypothetical protein [Myxococcota bacterium]